MQLLLPNTYFFWSSLGQSKQAMSENPIWSHAGSQEKVHGEAREGRVDHSEDRLPQIQHPETGNLGLGAPDCSDDEDDEDDLLSSGGRLRNKWRLPALRRLGHAGARRRRGEPLHGPERQHGHPRPRHGPRSRPQGPLRGDGGTGSALHPHHLRHQQVAA